MKFLSLLEFAFRLLSISPNVLQALLILVRIKQVSEEFFSAVSNKQGFMQNTVYIQIKVSHVQNFLAKFF